MREERLRSEVTSTAAADVFLNLAATSLAWCSRLEAEEEREEEDEDKEEEEEERRGRVEGGERGRRREGGREREEEGEVEKVAGKRGKRRVQKTMKALKCKPLAQFTYNYSINGFSKYSNIISHRSRSLKVDTSISEGRLIYLRKHRSS